MEFHRIVSLLELALARDLPGVAGQLPMSPRPRRGWEPDRIPANTRKGGVLLLLYPGGVTSPEEALLLLTVRSRELPQHAGQVSLPGGGSEAGESARQAALRETAEEVGVSADAIRILGEMSRLHVPVSGFVLHPFIAVADRPPGLLPDSREVARVIELPVRRLMDPLNIGKERRRHRAGPVEVPFFDVDGEKVWGATAMVLSEFLTMLGRPPRPWS